MSDRDLTQEPVEEVVKPKRGRPKKVVPKVEPTPEVEPETAVEETVIPELVITIDPPVEEEVKQDVDTPKKDDPCEGCDYQYGSLQCKHGCIHYKRK